MSKQSFLTFGLSLIFVPLFGQSFQNIHIQAKLSKTFNLSEIAEEIQYVGLESTPAAEFDDIHDVVWTKKYLFIQVSSVELGQRTPIRTLQYDHAGKFIQEYGKEDEKMKKLMYDGERDRLYVNYPNGEVKWIDFEKNVKKTWEFKTNPQLYNMGYFYSQSSEINKNGMNYLLVRFPEQTEDEEMLYNFIDHEQNAKQLTLSARQASFSFYGQTPVVSFGLDSTLYQIQDNKITPIVKFTVDPKPAPGLDIYGYQFQGFIGNYLCIHFLRTMQHYVYLKNMRSGKIFQTKYVYSQNRVLTDGVKDDMLNTGFCSITPLNRPGYFYFVKKRNELQGKPELLKGNSHHTIFFVKLN
jgi:hypothetical protein